MPFFKKKTPADELLPQLLQLQGGDQWEEALSLIDNALADSGDSIVIRVNKFVCHYHLGGGHEIVSDVAALLDEWPYASGRLSVLMLTLLCAHEAGQGDRCKSLWLSLAETTLNPWDLPTIPAFISDGPVLETRDAKRIPAIIDATRKQRDTSEQHRALLDALAAAYQERTRQNAEAPEQSSPSPSDTSIHRLEGVLEAFFRAQMERPEADRLVQDLPDEFEFSFIQDLGFKAIYMGTGPNQAILVHVWNYEIPLPTEGKDHNVNHLAAMEASMVRGRKIAQNPPPPPDPSIGTRFPLPIFMVDGGDFGGTVSHYLEIPPLK